VMTKKSSPMMIKDMVIPKDMGNPHVLSTNTDTIGCHR
jgi:hypothetical protein